MSRSSIRILLAFLHTLFLVALAHASANFQVEEIQWQPLANGDLEIKLSGQVEPTFTSYELPEPRRVIIDIAAASLNNSVQLPVAINQNGVQLISSTGNDINGNVSLALQIAEGRPYQVAQQNTTIVITVFGEATAQRSSAQANVITDMQVEASSAHKTVITLYGSAAIDSYFTREEDRDETHSSRLVVDLPQAKVEDKIIPVVLDSPVALVQAKQVDGGGRVIIDSSYDKLFDYEVKANGNYLELTLTTAGVSAGHDGEMVAMLTGGGAEGSRDFSENLLMAEEGADEQFEMNQMGQESSKTSFSQLDFGDYDKQRISVDFYKIDLHNVFRLIGEISNRNIIVDEGVGGSLTLSMKDVPWDFLLDVVLNLKDLAKEERYNTIVISPKSEGFTWPETVATQLEVTVEPITVTKRLKTSKGQVEAKKLLHEALNFVNEGQTQAALVKYEEGFQLWPDNSELAQQIATLALVKLGQNAKAAHYSKIAVQLDPTNSKAALIAAMSLANMESIQEAKDYFDLAISTPKPSRHALASYAAFSEQNGSFDSALNLLAQYEQLYGNSLDTMISRARIFDAMGDPVRADNEYKAIKLSGYELPADLKAFM